MGRSGLVNEKLRGPGTTLRCILLLLLPEHKSATGKRLIAYVFAGAIHGSVWAASPPVCTAPPALTKAAVTAEGAGELGNWFGSRGQQECAIASFRSGLSLDPKFAPLHYSLALSLLAERRSVEASDEVHAALHLDPQLDKAYLLEGVLEHDRGDMEGALRAWEQAARLNTVSTTAVDWIAKTRIEAGQYTEAADILRTAPPSEDLALDLLVANTKAGLYEEGIRTAQDALERHQDWGRLRVALATVLVQRNRFEDGLHLLQTALAQQPASLALQLLILRVLVLMNDTDTARALADELYAAHPRDFEVLYLEGLLRRQAGEYAAALPLLEDAVLQRPEHFDARFNLGILLAKLHREEESRQQLVKAAALPDASPEVHFQLASVERTLGQSEAAAVETRLYRTSLAQRVQHDELVSLSAQAAAKLRVGDWNGSADIERQVLGKHPDDAVHWYNLALALDRGGDDKAEKEALEHAVHLRPNFALALNLLGYLEARSGQDAAAETSFRAAIASAPQYAEAENNLGSLLSGEGKDTEAEAHFRAALAANPRLVEAWINLGATLASKNQLIEARAAVQSGLKVQPGNEAAQHLMQMLAQPGQASLR